MSTLSFCCPPGLFESTTPIVRVSDRYMKCLLCWQEYEGKGSFIELEKYIGIWTGTPFNLVKRRTHKEMPSASSKGGVTEIRITLLPEISVPLLHPEKEKDRTHEMPVFKTLKIRQQRTANPGRWETNKASPAIGHWFQSFQVGHQEGYLRPTPWIVEMKLSACGQQGSRSS